MSTVVIPRIFHAISSGGTQVPSKGTKWVIRVSALLNVHPVEPTHTREGSSRGQGVGSWNDIWKVILMLGKGDTTATGSLLGYLHFFSHRVVLF